MSQNSLAMTKLTILVVDDHEFILDGMLDVLKRIYPKAELLTAQTVQAALLQVRTAKLNLVVMDLSLREKPGVTAKPDTGIELLRTLIKDYPHLNLVVHSSYIKALVRIKPEIDIHKGGFTIADKSLSSQEMLTRVGWALQGLTYIKDLKGVQNGLKIKPEWLNVLTLAFEEGLQDKAIAEQLRVSERMVRHYWTKVQNILRVYPEEGKNIRIQTGIRAREEGLID